MSAETPAPSDAEVEALAEWNRHDVIEMTACNSADKWIQCKCGERIRVDPVAWPDETWPPTQVEEDYLTMHALSAVLSVQMATIAARHAAEVQAARAYGWDDGHLTCRCSCHHYKDTPAMVARCEVCTNPYRADGEAKA